MSGTVFKRCSKCSTRVKRRACAQCGGTTLKWAFTVDVGKDAKGRRRQQLRSGFTTKSEAERALQDVLSALQRGTHVERSAATVSSYLREEWLPATAPPRVRFDTWDDRRRTLENYVIPRVGDVRLQELNAAHLNRLYAELLSTGRANGESGLSPTTVRRVHTILRKALGDAVRWGRVERNATELTDPPPTRVVAASRRRSMTTWTETDLRRFLDATRDHPLHPIWVFAATTGVRRSELLGLTWPDLNLAAGTVTVRHTLVAAADGYRLEDDQKSIASGRTVHLDGRTQAMLATHRAGQGAIRSQTGPAWNPHDLVFPRPDGKWWNPPAISLAFGRAVDRADVPRIRLHDVRHTHATLLLAAGVNPKVVSERLGHSSVAFTLDTYAHVMPGMQPEAAELFVSLVYGGAEGSENDLNPASENGLNPPDETTEEDQ